MDEANNGNSCSCRRREKNENMNEKPADIIDTVAKETQSGVKPINNAGNGLEIAYVILEDCKIVVDNTIRMEHQEEQLPHGRWMDVVLVHHDDDSSRAVEDDGRAHHHQENNTCQSCYISFKKSQNSISSSSSSSSSTEQQQPQQLELNMNSVHNFDGMESHVLHEPCHRARSDASLMFGLLRATGDCVSVQRCSVLFSNDHQVDDGDDDHLQQATIVMTLSFPRLLEGKPGQRSLLNSKHKITKPLAPAFQLLLSLVRSDWSTLDRTMQMKMRDCFVAESASTTSRRLFRGAARRRQAQPLFPVKNSLQELYMRIRDSASSTSSPPDRGTLSQRPDCHLIRLLPKDILTERIAPFLRARSLDSLRCTCSVLHDTLKAVVPGLKLRLYEHQISSLAWMRQRESRTYVESDCLGLSSSSSGCAGQDGDIHRAVTGGLTVLLRQRPQHQQAPIRIRINQYSGREVTVGGEDISEHRKVARGGLLCDEPGMGKTITILSLLLQTFGLTSTPNKLSPLGKAEVADRSIFDAYWTEEVTKDFRIPILNKLLNDLLRCNKGRGFFPVDKLRKSIQGESYADFSLFQSDVEKAIHVYSPDDESKSQAQYLSNQFKVLVDELKQRQMRSAKKSFSNASGRHKSRVAGFISQHSQQKYIDSLVPSSGTLLVIPKVLMEHWQEQIGMHVDMTYMTTKIPLIFEYGAKDTGITVDRAIILCKLDKTHTPLVFLDRAGTKPLPREDFLAMFQIVITTTDRFKYEWQNGSFQSELKRSDIEGDTAASYYKACEYEGSEKACCPLLKVNWLRMVVDEGHSMSKGTNNSTIQFASWLTAQRRWAMTGTPTKQTATEVKQLKGLMDFLQHDFFSPRYGGEKAWKNCVTRPWREGALVAFFRLRSLLRLLMTRHTKHDIAELPPPHFLTTMLPFSFVEATTYNTLVAAVQSNLLLTSMEGKISGKIDSLLHRSQAKHAREALSNIRRVCVGWSRVIPRLSYHNFMETIALLNKHGFQDDTIEQIRQYLFKGEKEELTPCAYCGFHLSTPLLTPCCAGLICPECMDGKSSTCLLCDSSFDIDDFQRLQPGFELVWKSNLDLMTSKKSIQSAEVKQDNADALISTTSNQQNNDGILIRPIQQRRRTRKFGDGHTCEYDVYSVDGICTLCLEEHSECKLIHGRLPRCEVCYRVAQDCPEDESKSFYLVQKLEKLLETRNVAYKSIEEIEMYKRPLKVIVYSQFRKALNVVGDRLLRRFGPACVAEYWGRHRQSELSKFTHDKDCFCMLLSNDGSTGLDLSFVTNIFFLEEIWDKSLQDQAVARAWRMGAKGVVEVETLVAKNSVEETMQEIEKAMKDEDGRDARHMSEYQQAKTHSLLQKLRLITDYHQLGHHTLHNEQMQRSLTTSEGKALLKRKQPGPENVKDAHESCRIKEPKKQRRVRFQV